MLEGGGGGEEVKGGKGVLAAICSKFVDNFHFDLDICLTLQSSWSKGLSETKSKQQSPCSNCIHRPVMSWGNNMVAACTYCMHRPLMSRGNHVVAGGTYCMGSKVSSLSRMYLYSSYFAV